MVFLVYAHPPSFLRLPTAGALPVSRSPISLLEAEVTSSRLGQRLAVGTRPLAFPPSIRIVPVQTPDLLRTAPSRCQFCAPLSSLLPLQPLQHLPSPRTTLPSSPRLRSPVGLLFSLRKPLFPADLLCVSVLCPQTRIKNARHITMSLRASSSTTSRQYGSLPHCSRMTPRAKPCGQRSQVAFRIYRPKASSTGAPSVSLMIT